MEVKKTVSFVTGASGFLGSHLVDQLLELGDEVHVLVRKSSNLQWLLGKPVQFHYGGLGRNSKGLYEGLQAATRCFHVAGIIAARNRETYYQVNTIGTANLLEACLDPPHLQKIVLVSSLAARGPGGGGEPATEADECHPLTDYGKSKWDAEQVAKRYQARLPITIIRPPAIYGPRDKATLTLFKMARRGFLPLPAGGHGVMNLAYVLDVVQGILKAADHPRSAGETFYIGDTKNYTWGETARLIGQTVRKKPLLINTPGPLLQLVALFAEAHAHLTRGTPLFHRGHAKNFVQKNWSIDVTKARRTIGYEPKFALEQGLEQTVAWYESEGWL